MPPPLPCLAACLRRALLAAVAVAFCLAALPAHAVSYVFPGTLPLGCSGSTTPYTCGAITLLAGDTVTINAPKPATINFTSLTTNNAQINAAGTAANLNIAVSGTLTVATGAKIVGNVSAVTVTNTAGAATFGGNVASTTGDITLAASSTVAGSITSTTGNIYLYGTNTVTGGISCACNVYVYSGSSIGSTISSKLLDSSNGASTFGGAITTSTGTAIVGAASTVAGSVTSTGSTVDLRVGAAITGNVSSASTAYVYSGVSISGTTSAVYVDNSNGAASFGGSISTTTSGAYLAVSSTVAGSISATGGGPITLLGSNTVTGSLTAATGLVLVYASGSVGGAITTTTGNIDLRRTVAVGGNLSCACSVYVYAGDTISGSISSTYFSNTDGASTFQGAIATTTGGLYLGASSTVAGALTATTGVINLDTGSRVTGNLSSSTGNITLVGGNSVSGGVSCDCSFYVNTSASTIGGGVTVDYLYNGSGTGSTFSGTVRAATGDVNLGSNSRILGDAISDTGSVTLNTGSSVAQCARSRQTSGTHITMYSGSSSAGVCCGTNTCGSACVSNSSGSAMPATCASSIPTPVAAYKFNESSWSGTSGEVLDASGNGWNATAAGLSATKPTTASTSPAISGTPGTCSYGVFNRTNKDYVALPVGFPNLGAPGSFTVTAWIRTTDNTKVGQRIIEDDENGWGVTTVGWVLSLGDPGTGALRFLTRGTATPSLDTAANVIANNTWYFVAFGVDAVAKQKALVVYNTAGTMIAGVTANYSEASIGADPGIVSIGGETNAALGTENTNSYAFAGNIDEVRIYPALLTVTEAPIVMALKNPCITAATLLAAYHFEEASYNGSTGELKDSAGYSAGPYNGKAQGTTMPTSAWASPARASSPGTCGYASLPGASNGGGSYLVNGLPLSTTAGAQNSVSYWMYWDGTDSSMSFSSGHFDLYNLGGYFGFNTGNGDLYGIASTGLAGGWHHVAAVFTNGSVTGSQLYIDGTLQTLTQHGTPILSQAYVSTGIGIGVYTVNTSFVFSGRLDEVRVYAGAVTAAQVATLYAETHTCASPIDHLVVQHASGTGLTCTPSTLTVAACQDAACTTPYTGGISGTLSASGAGQTVNWPSGAAFTIAAGSSSATVSMQATTVGSVLVGGSGGWPVPVNATTCNFGSPLCTFTTADSGLLFNVPDHRAEVSNTVSISAVKKSDNSLACVPAFASVSKAVTFKCSYVNPSSGTLPVRVGGSALNSANNASAACDSTGRAVTLAFDSTGKANTTVIYADVGNVTLTASYTGSATDAGLSMAGSDSFTAAPYYFSVYNVTSGNIAAGNTFGAMVAAKNTAGNFTPNFGKETSPESVTLGFVRTQPQGTAAVNGTFSGSLGSFSGGNATTSNLKWSEVGRGEVSALLASGSYLGTGIKVAGASNYSTYCAAQLTTCVLPAGVTAVVYYGINGWYNAISGVTGSIMCSNGVFGDPLYGNTGKSCSYFVTSGSSSASTGTAGPFIPHHFTTATTPGCGSFSYAGQPFGATVTALSALGTKTLNYDGTANTSPNFAKVVSLSDGAALGVGTLSGSSIPIASFTSGVASATPAYSFTTKQTAPQALAVRAIDTDGVSSLGYTEGTMGLRSGRLRLSNAFGSEKAALQMTVQAQYWGGNSWVPNSADSCSALPAAAIVRGNYLDNRGSASSAWSTTPSTVTFANGNGTFTLSAPSPTMTGSVDVALNLGSATTDQSCLGTHPASTGAGLAWMRSQFGNCASTWDRDPGARATFGIYSPETKKTQHVREVF